MKRSFIALSIVCVLAFEVWAASPALSLVLSHLRSTKGPFTFIVMGDNRSGDRIYKKVITAVMSKAPLFVVNTGDIIPNPGDKGQWQNFWEISKAITAPYFLVPGNHDIDDERSEKVWRDQVDLPGNEIYYSFTVGKDIFVVIDSCEPRYEGKIEGRQFEWLKTTLDPKKYEHQFVFVHHPLFIPKGGSHEGEALDRYPAARDALHKLLSEKKVDVLFAGHEHTYNRIEKDGVTYIITGGAGAPLYGKESFNNFVTVRVDGKRVEIKAMDLEGALRDEFIVGNN